MAHIGSGAFAELVWHFFSRFFDKESLSANGEAETNVIQTLGILAVPGAFFVILLQVVTLTGWALEGARYLFVSLSMIVMGIAMVFKWDMLFPDRRDYQILVPLPLPLASLFLAKVAALALFLALFLVDFNFFATLFWPGIDIRPGMFHVFGAHIVSVVASGLFAALAVAAAQGVLINVLSVRAFRRVSMWVQTVLMAVLVLMLFVSPLIAGALQDLAHTDSRFLYYFPPVWYLGLYEWLRPEVNSPMLIRLGHTGIWALAGAAVLFLATYLPGYRRHARHMLEMAEGQTAGRGWITRRLARVLNTRLLPHPVQRAVFHFITQTITRSPRHRLFLATYSGFGIALAVLTLNSGRSGLLRLPLALSFVLVSALRAAFNFPSELHANWLFQTCEEAGMGEYLSATRKWIAVCGILPLFALIAPVEFYCFAPLEAAFHIAYGIVLSLLLMEILFFGFRKVPFTCRYFPGKVNLVGLTVMYIYGFTAYSDTMARLEGWLVQAPLLAFLFFAAAAAAHVAIVRWRDREPLAIDYEDAGDPVVRTLGLTAE